MSAPSRPADLSATPAATRSRQRAAKAPRAEYETQYRRTRLHEQRLLIRVACGFGAVMAGLRTVEQLSVEAWHPWQPTALVTVLGLSIVLAVLAWLPIYDRAYLPFANCAVPLRNAIAAAFVTGAAAAGQREMLMFLPLMVIGPAFFLGLNWRVALFAGVVTCLSFAAAASAFGLEWPVTVRTGTLLTLAVIGCAIVARHLDGLNRDAYCESRRIADLARQDALTGLANRRVFDEQLAQLWQRATEAGQSIAILLIDVDHFKNFNDRFGHQAGDRELCRVAAYLDSLVDRPDDVLARYGGEEFAVILNDVDLEQAGALAEAMRCKLAEGDMPGAASGALDVTISIGVACVEPCYNRQPRGAVQLADQALYEAKQSGRNRVVLRDRFAHRMLETGIFSRSQITRDGAATEAIER